MRKQPVGELTYPQQLTVRRLAGTMTPDDLAAVIKTSRSNLSRWARQEKISLNSFSYPPALVKQVCAYYARHGKNETEKKFPAICLRSIIERYPHQPRQLRWTKKELVALARMAGLVPLADQAVYFNRPLANAGSIRAAWSKRFQVGPVALNCLPLWLADLFIKPSCPLYMRPFQKQGKSVKHSERFITWIDAAAHLKGDVPEHLAQAIRAMAKFQNWLHGKNAKAKIGCLLDKNWEHLNG